MRYHMSVTPEFLVRRIQEDGVREVLIDFDGTDDEAIEIIRKEQFEHYPIGSCDNQEPDGRCGGH